MPIKEIKTLETLDFEKQLTFAYLSCERMFNFYENFSQRSVIREPKAFSDALRFMQDHIFMHPSPIDIEYFTYKVWVNEPNFKRDKTKWCEIGYLLCGMFWETLDFFGDNEESSLQSISDCCLDILRKSITGINLKNADHKKDQVHKVKQPRLLQEMVVQQSIIRYLQRIEDMDNADIQDLLLLQGRPVL